MEYKYLKTEQRNHILLITLDRPEKRNAINSRFWAELVDVWESFESEESQWVAVLTNNGPVFCAGSDIGELADGSFSAPPGKEDRGWCGVTKHLFKKPVIAAVRGSAVGGGTELVLAADIAVAADTAKFGLPEVKIGMIAAGGLMRFARQLPFKKACELAMTGESITAAQAEGYGLLNHVVPEAEVLNKALEIAEAICANAPIAVRCTKAVLYRTLDESMLYPCTAWDTVDYYAQINRMTEDSSEGNRAFIEKRSPVWKGR